MWNKRADFKFSVPIADDGIPVVVLRKCVPDLDSVLSKLYNKYIATSVISS